MAKKKDEKKEEKITGITKIVNKAVNVGIGAIIDAHPKFENYQKYILKHINKTRLNDHLDELFKSLEYAKIPDDKKGEFVYKNIVNYVATGRVFDNEGKEIILNKSLEEKARMEDWRDYFNPIKLLARRKIKGEKYLDKTIDAFQELYELFQEGDFSQKMPEIKESLDTLYDMKFLHPAVEILKYRGVISGRDYRQIKGNIKDTTKRSAKDVIQGMKDYTTYQKIAALILGIFGIAILLAFNTSKITGAVIGNSSTGNLIGIILILVSLGLFVFGKKKK